MQKLRMSVEEFNYRLNNLKDENSLKILYRYSLEIIKEHIQYKYGNNNFYSNVPHDVFTRLTIEYPPKKFIQSPISYLCQATHNFMTDILMLNDNNTLELYDEYPYFPDYDNNIEFASEEVEKNWYKLDELTRYIVYLNTCLKYKLNEIAEMLNLRPDYVRTKKSRAFSSLKLALKNKREEEK